MGTSLITERQRGADIDRLPSQQQNFVRELLSSQMFSPADAARKAGYKRPSNAAYRLMQKPEIQAALGKAQRLRNEELKIDAARVLRELYYIAFRDPLQLCDETGRLRIDDMSQIPEEMRRCIDGIKVKQTRTRRDDDAGTETVEQEIELKLVGKLGALELLAKHLGMLMPNGELPRDGNGLQLTLDAVLRGVVRADPVERRIEEEKKG